MYVSLFVQLINFIYLGAANQFTIDEYRLNRLKVIAGLKSAAAKALGGTCCRKDCKNDTCVVGMFIYAY